MRKLNELTAHAIMYNEFSIYRDSWNFDQCCDTSSELSNTVNGLGTFLGFSIESTIDNKDREAKPAQEIFKGKNYNVQPLRN